MPWNAAEFLVDAVLDTRKMKDESGTLAPTPFGDAFDSLLSNAIPSTLDLLFMIRSFVLIALRQSLLRDTGGSVAFLQRAAESGQLLVHE